MAKLTLNNVSSGYATSTLLNANNDLIEAALEKTLSRDGTSPNQMEASLDMNSNRVMNLDAPQAGSDAVRKIDLDAGLTTSELVVPALSGNTGKMLGTDGASLFWREADNLNYDPTGAPNLVATNVDAALDELDNEKLGLAVTSTISGNNTHSGNNTYSGTSLFTNNITFQGTQNYATATGTDTYVLTLSPVLGAYATGQTFNVIFTNANTITTPTININGLGAKTIKRRNGAAVYVGEVSGSHALVYDGVDMLILTLGDLSEGTWTPTIQDSSFSDAEGQTYLNQFGYWSTIGNYVFICGRLGVNSLGTLTGGDPAYIAGLPFANVSSVLPGGIVINWHSSFLTSAGEPLTGVVTNASNIALYKGNSALQTNVFTVAEVSTLGDMRFFGQYIKA